MGTEIQPMEKASGLRKATFVGARKGHGQYCNLDRRNIWPGEPKYSNVRLQTYSFFCSFLFGYSINYASFHKKINKSHASYLLKSRIYG